MAIRIGSNISSLQAQRRLGDSSASLSRVYERLSSGERINRAGEDAAGLAIAETLSAASRVYWQGVRNVNDASSYYAIAQAASTELKNIIIRGKELAEQAANGGYSDSQRRALNDELQTLGAEFNRILESTAFNGRQLFSKDNARLLTQAGESTLDTSLQSDRVSELDQIQRVSVGLSGAEANDHSFLTSSRGTVSADGRYVTFQSSASNLVGGDGNGTADIFVRDLQTGNIQLVSTTSTGAQSNGWSDNASTSAAARYVVFDSSASNLVTDDSNGTTDVFVKDLQTGNIQCVSTTSAGAQSNGSSSYASISGDGRYVAFESAASNLVAGDTNNRPDIFVKDLQTGNIQLISTTSAGGESNNASYRPFISADGRYVSFSSLGSNLVAGDTNGVGDVFVKDLQSGNIQRVSTTSTGGESHGIGGDSSISANGRYVTFRSYAPDLVSGDTNGKGDVFVKDLQSGNIQRVSTTSTGGESNGESFDPSISGDGRYVTFVSNASNFVTGDTNGKCDIFVKDLQTGEVRRASVSQSGREPSDSWDGSGNTRAAISADGRHIFFMSDFNDMLDGGSTGDISSLYTTTNPLAHLSQLSRFQWVNIGTQSEARNALPWLDSYLTELGSYQGTVGATLSRLSTAANVLSSSAENFKSAESRIRDADIAEETATLIRTQIARQAATAVLAQANQQPALAVTLLKSG